MLINRPFLEQNQKLQSTEAELQELHRRLREKDLQVAELKNLLNKSAFHLSVVIDRLTNQTQNPTSMKLTGSEAFKLNTSASWYYNKRPTADSVISN